MSTPRHYLFAVRALSKVFEGKFCAGLRRLYEEHHLEFHGQLQPLSQPAAFAQLMREATAQRWVVYAKRPFAGPRQVLRYLSRYTHRVAISPGRLLSLDVPNQTVQFAWKDYADNAKRKIMTLPVREFVRRFCLHLLPDRLVKIRHYGMLGNAQRQTKIAQARALLLPPTLAFAYLLVQTKDQAVDPPPRVCPFCGSPDLCLVEIVPPCSQARSPPAIE